MELDYVKLKEIKPAIAGSIREAESIIKSKNFPDIMAVHDIRVLMKKARAALRLVAPQLDTEFADREIQALRKVGRIMRSWRESTVHRKTLKDLKKRRPDIFSKLADNEKLNALLEKQDSQTGQSEAEKKSVEQIIEILNKTGYRIRFEPMNKFDPGLLIKELELTYNRVVNNYLVCRNSPKPSSLHELRKSSKDFLYQLWFFRPLNVPGIKALEKKLDTMTQNLGRYNDLAQLVRELDYRYEYAVNSPALDELAVILREEQDKCLSKAWPLAYKIFCPGQKLVNLLGFKLLVI